MSSLDTATEAAVIEAGRVVWNRARAHHIASRLEAADDLIRALDTYDAIHAGTVSPGPGDDWDAGLRHAAEAVLRRLAEVIRQAPELAVSAAADWMIEGVVSCPGGCGLYFDFCGTPQDLRDFIDKHDCAVAQTGEDFQ